MSRREQYKLVMPFPIPAKIKREARRVVSKSYWSDLKKRVSSPSHKKALQEFMRLEKRQS